GIINQNVEHEAVLLGLRKRVRAFLLDGVLCGQHEERIRQPMARSTDGHLTLLHCLKKRGLRLRGSAIDLVGQHDVCEKRAVQELEHALSCGLVLLKYLCPSDIRRHQVRRELNTAKAKVERIGQCADYECLGQSRHAHEQTVTTGENGDEQFFEHALLTD